MRRTSLLLLFAIACSSSVPSLPPSSSARKTGTVSGTVTLEEQPLPGASLMLSGAPINGSRPAVSDANGLFTFANLPPGTYTLRADLVGIQSRTMTVIVTGIEGVRVQIGMRLPNGAEAITVTAEAPPVLQ